MSLKRIRYAFLVATIVASSQLMAQVPLPPRSFQRLGDSELRHGSRILCLAFAPDGKTLAAGGGNDPLRLWDPATGRLLREINEPWVQALAFTASGDTLVFGGYHKSVRLWSLKQNKEFGRLEGHKAAVKAIAVSPDTSVIASGSQDGAVCIWRWDLKIKYGDFVGHTDEVNAVAFSPDPGSNVLASAGGDGVIIIWDIETKKIRRKIDAGSGILTIAFSADGKSLYSAGYGDVIDRWDVAEGTHAGDFRGHTGAIVSLFVQGDTLISGSLDKTVRFWDAANLKQLRSLPRHAGDCDALAVTKTGDFVAMAGTNNIIRICDALNGDPVRVSASANAPLAGLALDAEATRLACVTSAGQVLVWNAMTGQLVKSWDLHERGELRLAISPDGATLATAGKGIRLWNTNTGAALGEVPIKRANPIVALGFSPDGKTLAIGFRGGQVELWNVADKKLLCGFPYPGPLHALAWSADGGALAAAGGAKIVLVDPAQANVLRTFDVKAGAAADFPLIASLAFSPDGHALAAGGFDTVIRIFDLQSKQPSDEKSRRLCEGHLSAVYSLAFAKDGRTLVSGSFDRTVRLWETFSGKQIALFKGHVGEVTGVAFSRDDRSVFSTGSDTVVYRWDVPGLSNDGKLPTMTLGIQQIDDAWTNVLASEDARVGHDAMWRCAASAAQAIPHLIKAKKLYLLDPVRVKKLLRDLDSNHYPTRSTAMNELQGYGRWMEGHYDEAMAKAPSLEYKRRVEILKEKLNATNALSLIQERLRVRRFMLMCEQVASDEAVGALRLLADKAPEEELRAEAKASLRRLGKL